MIKETGINMQENVFRKYKKQLIGTLVILLIALGSYQSYLYLKYQSTVERLKKEITHDFIDPDAVKFRNLKLMQHQTPFFTRVNESFSIMEDRTLSERIKHIFNIKDDSDAISVAVAAPTLCGEANGVNSFGAYVGYKTFFIRDVEKNEVKEFYDYLKMEIDMDGEYSAKERCDDYSDEDVLYQESE